MDLCSGPWGAPLAQVVGFLSYLKPLWIPENVFSNPKLEVDFPLMNSHNVHKHSRNLSPQCHSLYKSHLPASAEPFLGCFSASSIGRDIIWCISDHILKHSPVSSGNKTRNDNEGTISHSTLKGFFSHRCTNTVSQKGWRIPKIFRLPSVILKGLCTFYQECSKQQN